MRKYLVCTLYKPKWWVWKDDSSKVYWRVRIFTLCTSKPTDTRQILHTCSFGNILSATANLIHYHKLITFQCFTVWKRGLYSPSLSEWIWRRLFTLTLIFTHTYTRMKSHLRWLRTWQRGERGGGAAVPPHYNRPAGFNHTPSIHSSSSSNPTPSIPS